MLFSLRCLVTLSCFAFMAFCLIEVSDYANNVARRTISTIGPFPP